MIKHLILIGSIAVFYFIVSFNTDRQIKGSKHFYAYSFGLMLGFCIGLIIGNEF